MHSQLLAGVERTGVYLAVDVGAQLLQGAVVSESPPLDVDTHPPFVSIQQLNVPHVLHVAGVGARPLERQACVTTLSWNYFQSAVFKQKHFSKTIQGLGKRLQPRENGLPLPSG